MLSKKDFITELYKKTIKDVTSDSVTWRAFLLSASYQYKYPFEDQVLIYAQRPFATACADFDTWHKEPLNRRINRGAKGIALMRERGGRVYLDHVFDAKDTNSPENKPFEIWSVKPGYEGEIIEALGNRFGYINIKDNLTDAVIGACINLGQDNIQDYVQEMYRSVEGSFLDELDDDNLRYRLLLTVQASVSYMVLTRLGLDAETSVGAEAFEWVHEFNTPATVNILGAATADISEICLREIERTVRSLDKENRTFDRTADVGYNEGEKNEIEKGGHNDVELHDGQERDTVPDLDSPRAEEPPHRQVRTDEVGVLEETPPRNVHDASDRSEVDGASERVGSNGESAGFGDYEPTGDEPWGDGADESREPDSVGADDEQHQGERGGRSVDQSNLQISDETLPPISEPQSLIQLLRHGDFLKKSKNEIVSFLRSEATESEKTEFVKSAYTPFLFVEIVKDGTQDHLGYRADAEGLLLYEGNFLTRTAETRMDWALITKLINALITDRNYLDEPTAGQQLSLLDVDYGKVEDAPAPPPKRQFGISQEVIDEFLRLGGCTRQSSQRIYGFYRRANNQAENIAFLRKEYETDNVGIIVGDKKYAVKWNDEGVRISTGERVSDISSAFLTWEMVDKRIRELLESGQYLSQPEAEKADEIWEIRVADDIAFLYRDDFENIPDEYKTISGFGWPDINNFYRAILHDEKQLTALVKQILKNEERVKEYPPRFRRYHDGYKTAEMAATFLREPVEFPPADPYILPPKQFVTQDKIDGFLTQSSRYSDSKLSTYSYFLRHKDVRERAKFLSNSYGVGGSGGLRTDNQHDGKGLLLYGGLQNRDTGVLLKWSQVAKRIDELIRQGKYLTDEEKADFDRYERKAVASQIRLFYSNKPDEFPKPYTPLGLGDYWEEVEQITKQIEDVERLDEIIEGMQALYETLTPESRDFEEDKKHFAIVKDYRAGRYNLFPNSPYRRKTPTKAVEAEVKAEPVEERKPPSEYDFHLGTTVYIGKDECEITSIDSERVVLFDGTLIPLDMDYETFMSRVRENNLNDHLKKKVEEKVEQKPVEEPKRDFSSNPILSRYQEAKKAYPQHIAMVRVGDFYEFFGDDAVKVAKVLDLTLTSRPISNDSDRIPMCGIPHHVSDRYLEKLIFADLSVAIIEDGNITSKEVQEVEVIRNNNGSNYLLLGEDAELAAPILEKECKTRTLLDGRRLSVCEIEPYLTSQHYATLREHSIKIMELSLQDVRGRGEMPILLDPSVVSKNECDAVRNFVEAMNLDDIEVEFDYDTSEVVARYGENEWRGKGLFEFLLNDVVTLDENYMLVEGMGENQPVVDPLLKYAEQYGAQIKTVNRNAPELDEVDNFDDVNAEEIRAALAKNGIVNGVVVDEDALAKAPFIQQVTKDVEKISREQTDMNAPDRFSIRLLPNEGGITGIWDAALNRFYEEGNQILRLSQQENTIEYLAKVQRTHGIEPLPPTFTTPTGKSYRIGDGMSSEATEHNKALMVIENVDEDYVWYILLDHLEQEPVKINRESFERYLDTGYFAVVEKKEPVKEIVEEPATLPEMVEAPKPKPTLPVYNSHPEIPDSEKHNYRITDDNLGVGGEKEKFKRNMAAINLLHELEFENRLATPEEQEILAQYTGWGGLDDAFDETKDNWSREFQELYTTLSPEEYRKANESTLTAFYTPPVIIRAMYDALEKMGLKRGNILEPSCGTGNFMGMLPDSMSESKIYGVELDSLTGRIARQLYQKNGITIDGYEKTHFPDSFFDVAIGNVPFGDFKVVDKKYDKHNFLIHDYFFAKTLDKVRPGGVIAFVTSSGTLDKANPTVRKYLAQRADLIGAIRLPDTAFKNNAGTRVVSDIIFLQKRDRIIEAEPDWVHLGKDENGITMNQYFIDNPDMVLGEMVMRSGPYGDEPTCRAYEGQDLGELLSGAIANINAEIQEVEVDELTDEENKSIPADPTVKNYSFTLVDGKVYYRQNSVMNPVETSVTGENRIKGMIGIRDTVRELIDAQLDDAPDSEIKRLQEKLNTQYDTFTKKYGLINSRGNAAVFSDDNSYFLLCSLEILDDNKELKAKADMFTKRTIKPQTTVERVDTASEALAVAIGERAFVDMEYMTKLTGKSEEELFADLKGVIFLNPKHSTMLGEKKYLMADEYLSGNVREKLAFARKAHEEYGQYAANVEALEKVQPVDLTAAEIGVKLGSVWVPQEDVQDFIYELLGTSRWMRSEIEVKFVKQTGEWVITNKTHDRGNVKANNTYGTKRINAYQIIEETLNLKDVRIFDYVEDASGKKTPVLNKKETAIAQGKQEQIKRAFEEWIWRDPERRERLCKLYNEKFNSYRPREYDGSHIQFYGMNPEITLRPHQKNAVARIMYGGNSLLAHVVGAGKTFTMVAAAQESKRLGLCNKSMFVVPNHLIEQWASEYLQLYPSANILVATKKDFETKNRKKFCARIATGDYDAVIIGHSQFEKIPVSVERQIRTLEYEIETIMQSMAELERDRGNRVTVKRLAKSKKALEARLERLNDQSRKDDVVTFEELGVDRLFIDEAHFYKNLAAYSKMRNVAGISQTEAQKSSDLYMKCRYLDELTGSKGCVFATGTPISNTMVELYTMQKYLQYNELRYRDLLHFDSWASTFGETVTAIELAPDGTGYRAKTRFAKFFNIPELMAMFKQVADIQTADMLNLPTPEAHFHIVKVEASEIQKDLVQSFAERAEQIHNRKVSSDVDNMLLVTNDGRKAALDQRLINPMLEDFSGSKVNVCVENIYDIWERNTDKKSAQLVFCDLSTPKNDGNFNVYDDIRTKLIERGIPPEEIAFIHTADTDTKKKELFAKVRRGQVRILIGSTFKMGAGTNVQERLIALHDLDVPWRPSDLEQRAGRIVRQGNTNPEVDLYRYVTEGTFDAYSYQLLESKQKFISQIMTSKSPVRSAEDVDETALSYAEIKALASGNPKIMEKMQLDADVAKLKLQKASHLSQRYALEDALIKKYPRDIAEIEERIKGLEADIKTAEEGTIPNEHGFSPMVIMGVTYTDKTEAEQAITDICSRINNQEPRPLGEYRGFKTEIGFDGMSREFFINLKGVLTHKVLLGKEIGRIVLRIDNQIEKFAERKKNNETNLAEVHRQVEAAKAEIAKPFPDEALLEEKSRRLDELNSELNMDRKENEIVDGAEEITEDGQDKKPTPRDDRDDR